PAGRRGVRPARGSGRTPPSRRHPSRPAPRPHAARATSTHSLLTSTSPFRTARWMLSANFGHVSNNAVEPPDATCSANTGQLSVAGVVHWILVCFGLFFFTNTWVPHDSQSCGVRPEVRNSWRSARESGRAPGCPRVESGCCVMARPLRAVFSAHWCLLRCSRVRSRFLLGTLRFEVRLHFPLPFLVGLGGVDLELEALRHVLAEFRGIHVELFVPAAQLVERTVLLGQQGIVDLALVAPDPHVLHEAL